MTKADILAKCDHTQLSREATWKQIKDTCDDGIKYSTASVCIPASYVKQAADYVNDICMKEGIPSDKKLKICTVVGFPNGYSTTAVKVFETEDAVKNGADEIDMVINIGWVKDGLFKNVEEEIKAVKAACNGRTLKIIIETCLLDENEKKEMCRVVTRSGADYIKTSTGFAGGGATFEDVKLFKENVGKDIKIKAAGGISSFEDAEKFVELGADRLGTSRLVKLLKESGEGK